jgi:hypothetical protein
MEPSCSSPLGSRPGEMALGGLCHGQLLLLLVAYRRERRAAA